MIAVQECANYESDGSCAGLMLTDDLRTVQGKKYPKCLLGTPGIRCRYFEEAVMGMDRSALSEGNRRRWNEALRDYRVAANVPNPDAYLRLCRLCHKRPLEPNKQLCYVCRDKKARETKRKWWSENKPSPEPAKTE